jgi:ribonuclease P protein component
VHCDVRVDASLLRASRVGFVVPKHGRSSVDRNRLRRRLSEIVRLALLPHLVAADVLIRVRREAYDASFAELEDDVRVIRRRLSKGADDR